MVFLQEVSPRWEEVLRERYVHIYPHMLFAPAGGAGGLGVMSRFPLEDAGFLPAVLKHPAWLVRVRAPQGDLIVLNVHLRASTRPGQNLISGLLGMSADHEAEIRAFFRAANAEPHVVVGDFNEGADGAALEWLERQGFINSLSYYRPGEPTWRALGGVLRNDLDHILARGCVEPLDAWVIRSGNSDHWPVVARLDVASPEHCL